MVLRIYFAKRNFNSYGTYINLYVTVINFTLEKLVKISYSERVSEVSSKVFLSEMLQT